MAYILTFYHPKYAILIPTFYMTKAKTRVRVGLELSEEFEVKIGMHQGSVLSLLVFAIMVYVVMENVRNGLLVRCMQMTWF